MQGSTHKEAIHAWESKKYRISCAVTIDIHRDTQQKLRTMDARERKERSSKDFSKAGHVQLLPGVENPGRVES